MNRPYDLTHRTTFEKLCELHPGLADIYNRAVCLSPSEPERMIPHWLMHQTAGDIAKIGSSLQEIERSLTQGDTRGVATYARTIRRTLHYLERDLKDMKLFNSGVVQRRDRVR
jgi:hypothetical protein